MDWKLLSHVTSFSMFLISFLSHVWAQAQKNVWTHSPPYKGPISTDITLWQNECLGYCQFPTPPPPFCLFVIFIFSISFGSFCVLELCNWTPVVDLEMISGNLYRSLWLLFSFVIIVIIISMFQNQPKYWHVYQKFKIWKLEPKY